MIASGRLAHLRLHFVGGGGETAEIAEPPVVPATQQLSDDPIIFLKEASERYPEVFAVERPGSRYLVVADSTMFDDVLGDESIFGNPITPNMSVNRTVFNLPVDVLEQKENVAVKTLRRLLLRQDDALASSIAAKFQSYIDKHLGDEGECDLREIGECVFWPMTQALFGDSVTRESCPHMFKAFEDIDNNFGKALRGRPVKAVEEGVKAANEVYERIARGDQGNMGPVLGFYSELMGGSGKDPVNTAKFATSAWWGGQGNTLPSTVWTLGYLLADPQLRAQAYQEADQQFSRDSQPDQTGHYDFSKLAFLTAALKETLRVKTFSVAWRLVQEDTVLESKVTGRRYQLRQGDLVGLHWCLRHFDERLYDAPEEFRPARFMGGHGRAYEGPDAVKYSWAPFSAGIHKCSGYPLAMLEIPVVLALMFREYEMELLDPLPGVNWKSSFGVIGPNDDPVRMRYRRRRA